MNEKSISGKYFLLEQYLKSIKDNNVIVKYSEIEKIIGEKLPASAYNHRAWWGNGGHAHSNAWSNAGFKVQTVKFGEFIEFNKINSNSGYGIGKVCVKCGEILKGDIKKFCSECGHKVF